MPFADLGNDNGPGPGHDNPSLRPRGIERLRRKKLEQRGGGRDEATTTTAVTTATATSPPPSPPEDALEPFDADSTIRVRRTIRRQELTVGQRNWLAAQIKAYVNRHRPPIGVIGDVASALATRYGVEEGIVWPLLNACRPYMPPGSRVQDYQRSQIVATALGADRSKAFMKISDLMDAEKPMVVTVYLTDDGGESPVPTDCDKVGFQKIEYVADIATQLKAATIMAGLHGASSPSTVNHEIGLTEELQAVTEDSLKLEMAKLLVELKQQGIDEKLLDQVTPVDVLDGAKLITES